MFFLVLEMLQILIKAKLNPNSNRKEQAQYAV